MQKFHSLNDIQKAISRGDHTLPGLVDGYLRAIEEKKHLNAFLEVFGEEARQQAVDIQEKINSGTAGKLAGMVIGVKDNICYKDHRVSASSRILEGFESLFTATALERIIAEDAIVIGRLN